MTRLKSFSLRRAANAVLWAVKLTAVRKKSASLGKRANSELLLFIDAHTPAAVDEYSGNRMRSENSGSMSPRCITQDIFTNCPDASHNPRSAQILTRAGLRSRCPGRGANEVPAIAVNPSPPV